MQPNDLKLLIVESPNKIKKISSILDNTWLVKASVGHIRALPKKTLGIDRADKYRPTYEIDDEKKSVVAGLYKAVKQVGVNNVYLATDPDREGEAISFHLCKALGLDTKSTKRVTFFELTHEAINDAVINYKNLDMALVAAQEARRVIDRLAGFEVTSLLNLKLPTNGSFLTAGRVQSVALKLAVDRENEIAEFDCKLKYKLKARFIGDNNENLDTNYVGVFNTVEQVKEHYSRLSLSKFKISKITNSVESESPSPPFTTSSLQQSAIRRFKWGAVKVMNVAQKLFESGHITYMRTDSPNLSEIAIDQIRDYLIGKGQVNKFLKRNYKAKVNAQEAHEAIRPTNFESAIVSENDDEQKLYMLIYMRAVASQMIDAQYDQRSIVVNDVIYNDNYLTNIRVLKEQGFKMFFGNDSDDNKPVSDALPSNFVENQTIKMVSMIAKGIYDTAPKRYDEATLVKALEDKGIGRPSTYATILNNIIILRKYLVEKDIEPSIKQIDVVRISSIFDIEYKIEPVKIGGQKNALLPQESGIKIIKFLNLYFKEMVNYNFTSEIEKKLDLITEGKNTYNSIVSQFDEIHSKNILTCNQLADCTTAKKKMEQVGIYKNGVIQYGFGEKSNFLFYNKKYYSVPLSSAVSLDLAIDIIVKQELALKEKIVKIVDNYTIKIGDYGYYFVDIKGNNFPINKKLERKDVELLNADQLKDISTSYKAWKSKQTKK